MDNDPQFVGFITHVQLERWMEGPGWILVESHANKLVRRHKVLITDQTKILIRKKGVHHLSDFSCFQIRRWVKIWFATSVENLPQKEMTARAVVIVDRP